ncbi:peptidase U32 family protein [Amphibacillus sp. Q70]|uniref:peptidase U32 family protein n=1 Tax=Amphibacillus sp. Q70 TaxID=3453416 RepID=UPI003F853CEC
MDLYRPELQATARNLEEVKRLANVGADAIFVGHQQFGNRLPDDFTLTEIEQATEFLHKEGKKVYVMVNAIYHNEHLEELPDYLTELERINVDGIVAGDQSIFQILRDLDSSLQLTWNPATLSTNYQTLNYWSVRGMSRATLSNELALDAVIEIKQNVQFPIEIQIHGMTCIFQSKRKLVRNYYNHIEKDYTSSEMRYIKESKKPETHYPIFEDINGTHIMSNEDIVMIDHLDKILEAEIDGLFINGLLKTIDYNEKMVELYREAIDTYLADPDAYQMKKTGWKQLIYKIQPQDRKIDTGFYFKEQIY